MMVGVSASKYVVQAGWDDAPHLSADEKAKQLASCPPHLRDARSKGAPSMGAGAIYPVDPTTYTVDPFPIPPHWRRVYALDVGWNRTAVVWGAIDPDTDILYLYSEHYQGEQKPIEHASAIKARGEWIPGVIDPASRGRSQDEGKVLFLQYQNQGLNISMAMNSVEPGIYEVWTRLANGLCKVFRTLVNWFAEVRLYRRDEKGHIVKKFDHLMDATRYLVMSGLKRAICRPVKDIVGGNTNIIADSLGGY